MTLYTACSKHERDAVEAAMQNESGDGPFAIDVGRLARETPAQCGMCDDSATILIKIEPATAVDVIRLLLDLASDHDRARRAAWN